MLWSTAMTEMTFPRTALMDSDVKPPDLLGAHVARVRQPRATTAGPAAVAQPTNLLS